MADEVYLQSAPLADSAQIPHRIFRNVLGPDKVAALLDYVTTQRGQFAPARIYNRLTHEAGVEADSRTCWRLTDLGPFADPIRTFVDGRSAAVAKDMGLYETRLDAREIEICAYEDKGFFRRHTDTMSKGPIRVLTCVYYFSTEPQGFNGGSLRLFPLPGRSRSNDAFVDVPPDCDTLVMFPSMMMHEVLPVAKPSEDWRANRFNITTWACRPKAARA